MKAFEGKYIYQDILSTSMYPTIWLPMSTQDLPIEAQVKKP